MEQKRRTSWLGGFIRYDKKGRPTYWIRKRIGGGLRLKVSTKCHTEPAALVELATFEKDPLAYEPKAGGGDMLRLDRELVAAFLAWSLQEKGNTREWVTKQRNMLAWWASQLRGVDLRKATLSRHIIPALDRAETSRQHRIAILKALYSWLRTVRHRIATAEDPTYGQLDVPQSRPEQWKREKAISLDHHIAAVTHLEPHWRDAATVLAGTGWHVTELDRFAHGGKIEERRSKDKTVAAVLVCPRRKSGEPQRTEVSLGVAEAARRIRRHGSVNRWLLSKKIGQACAKAGVPKFGPGSYRHSVATWAIEQGADIAMVSQFIGHKSARTTKKFYATHATPPKVPTLT